MHTAMQIGSMTLMGADAPPGRGKPFGGFNISLDDSNEAEVKRLFAALSEGGSVMMPLAPTFWSPPVRHVHGQVRRQLDGQRPRTTGLVREVVFSSRGVCALLAAVLYCRCLVLLSYCHRPIDTRSTANVRHFRSRASAPNSR